MAKIWMLGNQVFTFQVPAGMLPPAHYDDWLYIGSRTEADIRDFGHLY